MVRKETIVRDDFLYRRVLRRFVLPDRISSAAFKIGKRPDAEPSVDLERMTTAEKSRERGIRSDLCVYSLVAHIPMDLGMGVDHDPCPEQEPDNDAHTLIKGNDSQEKCEKMARALRFVLAEKAAS